MDENLEYMFRSYGFYFPDAEYITDPEGLLKYLVSHVYDFIYIINLVRVEVHERLDNHIV